MRWTPAIRAIAQEILHHGRDRNSIVSTMDETDCIEFGYCDNVADVATACYTIQAILSPVNDVKVKFASIVDFIDPDNLVASEFIYSPKQAKQALQAIDIWQLSAVHNKELKTWLNGRGVTDIEIEHHRIKDISQIKDNQLRIYLGIAPHPAIMNWLGACGPTGCLIPVLDAVGNVIGGHIRFLDLVPKVKFGAPLPGIYLQHNIYDTCVPWLTEGVFDALAIGNHLVPGAKWLSPSSGFWQPEQTFMLIGLVKKFGIKAVNLLFDRDRVGRKMALFTYALLATAGVTCSIYEVPAGFKDVAEFVHRGKQGVEALEPVTQSQLLKLYKSMPWQEIIEYSVYLDNRQASYNNNNYHWINT